VTDTTDTGFDSPRDKSPIEVPADWSGGAVRSTGGDIYERAWVFETDTERIKVSYPPTFEGVQAERFIRDGNGWERDGFVAMRDADERTADECRQIAGELMEELR
jgi:hypothetical protein